MRGTILIMGSGGSMGIPVIGCHRPVCTSENTRNIRTRSACLVRANGKTILIDVGPDFRFQALKHNLSHLDAVLFTHAHQDHVGGIDDLRPFFIYHHGPIPCYMSEETAQDIQARFAYVFRTKKRSQSLIPKLDVRLFDRQRGVAEIAGISFRYFTFSQAGMPVNGFVIGDLAYVSDIKEYPDSIFEDLKGVKTLIISALRKEINQLHFTVDEAVAFSQTVGAEKTWLTHIAHELDHDHINSELPQGIQMAYDGLELSWG